MAEHSTPKEVKHPAEPKRTLLGGLDPHHKIATAVQASSSGTWGYAIYRCTYESDEEFAKLLELLVAHMRNTFEISGNYTYLLDAFQWTIFDDRAKFDGASRAFVRDHYNAWIQSSEAGVSDEEQSKQYPRYRLAIHVDADVLDAVVHKAPPPGVGRTRSLHYIGYVNLINLEWRQDDPNALYHPHVLVSLYGIQRLKKPHKAIVTSEDVEEEKETFGYGYPEVDGCTAWQVGWCKVRVGALAAVYAMLLDGNEYWEWVYDRPPDVTDTDPSTPERKAIIERNLKEAGVE